MKVVFISGVLFGHSVLEHVLKNNFQISTIFSYNDSKKKFYSDIIDFDDISKKYNIPNIKVSNINDQENIELLQKLKPDLILVMGWSQLLKSEIIKIPKIGIIGSHPTELPKYRGRAPIPWSILKNLQESALTFFWIEEGIDNGHILDQQKFSISKDDDATSLYEQITEIAKDMIIKNLNCISKGEIEKTPQDESKFLEVWPKRTVEDGKIDWTQSSNYIHSLIRASTFPYPGAFTFFLGKKLKIWKSTLVQNNETCPGKILAVNKNSVRISTGNGVLELNKISYDDKSEIQDIFSQNHIGDILG